MTVKDVDSSTVDRVDATELHLDRVERIENRSDVPVELLTGPVAVLHAVPTDVDMTDYIGLLESLPDPPTFGLPEGNSESSFVVDSGKVEARRFPWLDAPSDFYYLISTEGWFETATVDFYHSGGVVDCDEALIQTLKGGVECLRRLRAKPPIAVHLTLSGVEDYRFDLNAFGYGWTPDVLPARCHSGPSMMDSLDCDPAGTIRMLMRNMRPLE